MEREYMEKINNYCQKRKFTLDYAEVGMTGPSHDPEFTFVVKINDVKYGIGTGKNKKEAKAVAAKKTWEMIGKQPESPSNMQAAELMTSLVTLSPGAASDYVSILNVYSQKTLKLVDYPHKTRTGDAHTPMFSCSCTINGFVYGVGTGTSLAAAKQAAAKQALEKLSERGSPTRRNEKSDSNSTFSEHSNFSRVPAQSELDNICSEDASEKLVQKMKDMAVCEKPSPSQTDAQSSALKPGRKLAANFDNARNKEEKKKMSDSDESLPDLDTNTSEENESPHTVNKRKVRREVKELARLEHENIVRYYCSWEGYDHVTHPGSRQKPEKEVLCLFIQMELCEKGPLENWIDKNRLHRKYHEMAQNKFLQILKGVKYIHSKGLIHRDLKPQNIFISHEDKIKIGDFGLVTSVACETLTENRGTKSYMAPEQVGNSYGREVDIYALGLIWFEILSACSRHEKTKVWCDVRGGELPQSFTNQFPTEAPIIKKMLSRDSSGRYSASEILEFFKSVDKDNALKTHTR